MNIHMLILVFVLLVQSQGAFACDFDSNCNKCSTVESDTEADLKSLWIESISRSEAIQFFLNRLSGGEKQKTTINSMIEDAIFEDAANIDNFIGEFDKKLQGSDFEKKVLTRLTIVGSHAMKFKYQKYIAFLIHKDRRNLENREEIYRARTELISLCGEEAVSSFEKHLQKRHKLMLVSYDTIARERSKEIASNWKKLQSSSTNCSDLKELSSSYCLVFKHCKKSKMNWANHLFDLRAYLLDLQSQDKVNAAAAGCAIEKLNKLYTALMRAKRKESMKKNEANYSDLNQFLKNQTDRYDGYDAF